jgi:tRNA(fMet)-specific endonuclease VapC
VTDRYILDTDHVSLILRDSSGISAIAQQYSCAVTIITVQELFNGWTGRINTAALTELPGLYNKLWSTMTYLQTVEILDFTLEADACLRRLMRDNPLLRKNRLQKDMRIAAIALSLDATVVTRNKKDFELVPGLTIVDWTAQ